MALQFLLNSNTGLSAEQGRLRCGNGKGSAPLERAARAKGQMIKGSVPFAPFGSDLQPAEACSRYRESFFLQGGNGTPFALRVSSWRSGH